MMKNLTRYLWNRSARCVAFWFIVIAFASTLYAAWASLSLSALLEISLEGFSGELSRVTSAAFSFSLAKALVSFAFGLLIAFGVMHAAMASISIRGARIFIESFPSKRTFAGNFDQIRKKMTAHPLLGHAWKAFEDSLLVGGAPLRTTQRPQSFFNTAMLREKLIGLKIMPAAPSYFVGAGLLLTFVGLLIALYKTAEGMQAVQLATGGAGAAAMQSALRELTQAATFKFATSIAGLSSWIMLAFAFRLYTIRMEASLGDFCEALESKLSYLSSQSVSIEMRDSLAELEKINSELFLARFGEEVASALVRAFGGLGQSAADRLASAQKQIPVQAVAVSWNRAPVTLEEGVATAVTSICEEGEDFSDGLQAASTALEAQEDAIELASTRSRESADILGKFAVAQTAVDSVEPANDKVAKFAAAVGGAVKQEVDALVKGQEATGNSRQGLAAPVDDFTDPWENCESRFVKGDENLDRAFEKLAQLKAEQPQQLGDRADHMPDKGLAGATDRFAGPVQGFGDGAQDLFDAVGKLRHILKEARAAA